MAELGFWALAVVLAIVIGIAGNVLAPLLPWDSATSLTVAKAGSNAVLTALIFPMRIGVALQIFRGVRGLEPGS